MPSNKRTAYEKKAKANGWKGFVRCDLDVVMREECNAAIDELPQDYAWEWMLNEVQEFKFSFSYDLDTDTATASMTGNKSAQPIHVGYTLTARARTVERALKVLWYKHTQILKEMWTHDWVNDEKDADYIG